MENKSLATKDLCMIGLWAAIIAVLAQISIPMPMGVPMTMQTFAITMAAIVLGSKKGFIATGIYVLLGAIGLPVYAGFSGGISYIVGVTGGFLISFPLMAFIIGLGVEYRNKIKFGFTLGIVVGTLSNYIVGVIMFCMLTGSSVGVGITACVIPFIPTAIIKAVVAAVLGLKVRTRLVNLA